MSADDKPRLSGFDDEVYPDGATIEDLQEIAQHDAIIWDDDAVIRFIIVNDPIINSYFLRRYAMEVTAR